MNPYGRPDCNVAGPALPLCMVGTGMTVVYVGGARGGIVRRLADMGMRPGVEMTVVSGGDSPGPVVVKIEGSRLMLGRGIAHKIMVRPK